MKVLPSTQPTVHRSNGNSLKWFGSKKKRAPGRKPTKTRKTRAPFVREDKPFRFLELPPELRNRIYGFFFTDSPRRRGPSILCVFRPGALSVINNSDEWEGQNTSMLAILQTSRQVYDEARDLPFACNYISFDRNEHLGQFVGHASERLLSRIQHVQMDLTIEDYDAHNWGMLKFFPKLSSLRLIDVKFQSDIFLDDPYHPVAVKVGALRGLKELDVVLLGGYDIEDDEESQQDDDEPNIRLGAAWRAMVTQPKPIAE